MTAAFYPGQTIRVKRALVNNPVARAISRPVGAALKFITRGYYAPGLTFTSIEIASKRLSPRSKLILKPEGISPIAANRPAIAKNFLAHLLPEAEIRLESYQGRDVAKYFRAIRHAIYRFKRKYNAITYEKVIAALLAKATTAEDFKAWEKVIYSRFQAYAKKADEQAGEENNDFTTRLLVAYRNVLLICIIKAKDQQGFQDWIDRADSALKDKPLRYVYIVGILLKKSADLKTFTSWHREVFPKAKNIHSSKLRTFLKALEAVKTIEEFGQIKQRFEK